MCMVWNQLAGIRRTPPVVTTDFLYIRFTGDRSIEEKNFGKIQKIGFQRWGGGTFFKRAREEQQDRLNLAIVAANNHYAGFVPGTANTFRKMTKETLSISRTQDSYLIRNLVGSRLVIKTSGKNSKNTDSKMIIIMPY